MEADFVKSAADGVTTEAGLFCTRCRFGGVPSGGLVQSRAMVAEVRTLPKKNPVSASLG